jgi:hypothetical protein
MGQVTTTMDIVGAVIMGLVALGVWMWALRGP